MAAQRLDAPPARDVPHPRRAVPRRGHEPRPVAAEINSNYRADVAAQVAHELPVGAKKPHEFVTGGGCDERAVGGDGNVTRDIGVTFEGRRDGRNLRSAEQPRLLWILTGAGGLSN
jgi:hypothetical protein